MYAYNVVVEFVFDIVDAGADVDVEWEELNSWPINREVPLDRVVEWVGDPADAEGVIRALGPPVRRDRSEAVRKICDG